MAKTRSTDIIASVQTNARSDRMAEILENYCFCFCILKLSDVLF